MAQRLAALVLPIAAAVTAVITAAPVVAGSVAAPASAALLPMALPADLQPLARELRRHGFTVLLQPPPKRGAYGQFDPKTRRLWVAPIAFELEIGRQTFLHEAVHAVQSCPTGQLTPIGWRLPLAPVVEQEIGGILTRGYHPNARLVEREAFAMQGQSDAPIRVLAALRQRCRSRLVASP